MSSFITEKHIEKPINPTKLTRKLKMRSQKPPTTDKIKYFKVYEEYKDYTNGVKDRIKDIDTSCNKIFELLKDISSEVWWNRDKDKKFILELSRINFLNNKERNELFDLTNESKENDLEFKSILKMLSTLCEKQKKNRIKLHQITSEVTKKFGVGTTKLKSKSFEPILEIDEGGRKKRKSAKSTRRKKRKSGKSTRRKKRKSVKSTRRKTRK